MNISSISPITQGTQRIKKILFVREPRARVDYILITRISWPFVFLSSHIIFILIHLVSFTSNEFYMTVRRIITPSAAQQKGTWG